jgi:hypothetical protein
MFKFLPLQGGGQEGAGLKHGHCHTKTLFNGALCYANVFC